MERRLESSDGCPGVEGSGARAQTGGSSEGAESLGHGEEQGRGDRRDHVAGAHDAALLIFSVVLVQRGPGDQGEIDPSDDDHHEEDGQRGKRVEPAVDGGAHRELASDLDHPHGVSAGHLVGLRHNSACDRDGDQDGQQNAGSHEPATLDEGDRTPRSQGSCGGCLPADDRKGEHEHRK
ncbi:MAG: hypothetical protein CMP12_13540 [Zunongwangia sp.]|nr:hypothetical protein [Zunongwangia sp.]